MDPDETIRRMRELVAALTGPGLRPNAERARLGADLADHVEALDGWLSRGGARPRAWIRPGEPHTVTITREQLENWAGRALADDEVDTLDSCDEQQALAASLAGDDVFGRVAIPADSTESYASYPCQENSGGSLVTAGRRYALEQPLTFDALRTLAGQAADPAWWQTIAQIRPEDPGSGEDAHVCYSAAGGGNPRYLRFHATEEEPMLLYVEVSQAEDKVELCPSPG